MSGEFVGGTELDAEGEPLQRRASKPPIHWADMGVDTRRSAVQELGMPAFRANQISRRYFERLESDPTSWSDLPEPARASVRTLFPHLLEKVTDTLADSGTTVKSLYKLFDGALVECVLMRYGLRRDLSPGVRGVRSTLCVSSQVGCGIGCPFCATGQAGLTRNLSAAEIVEQVRLASVALASGNMPGGQGVLGNVVFMGMGEPLANYSAVASAVRTISASAPNGFGISARGITVSTSGLVPRVADLAGEGLPVTLAVSLHAPDDDLRDELVPINKRWKVAELLDAAKMYFDVTGRRVSIEYALMRDINDQAHRADLLARELNARGRGWAHVNLIPLNPTPGSKWTSSRSEDEKRFLARLESARIPVTIRDTRGQSIDGACGQLAARLS